VEVVVVAAEEEGQDIVVPTPPVAAVPAPCVAHLSPTPDTSCPCAACVRNRRLGGGIFTCSICFEDCLPVHDPASLFLFSPPTEEGLPYGLMLGSKEDGHVACLSCARDYVEGFLKKEGKCFPVCCHEVRLSSFPFDEENVELTPMLAVQCDYELTDDDAARILGEDLEKWVRLLSFLSFSPSLPPFVPSPMFCSPASFER
jgi:hypothetical protein